MPISNESQYNRLRLMLAIDALRVDDELIALPGLIVEAGECVAEAIQVRDNCKNRLDFIKAKVATHLRDVPVSDEGKAPKKRTDAAVQDEVLLDNDVQDALAELEMCRYDVALWQALFEGLREKAGSLKRISEMMVTGYIMPTAAYQERRYELAQKRSSSA